MHSESVTADSVLGRAAANLIYSVLEGIKRSQEMVLEMQKRLKFEASLFI